MKSLHHTECLIQVFAEHGYQVDPFFLDFIQTLPLKSINEFIKQIDKKAPNTVVVSFQTYSDIMGNWIVIVRRAHE